MSTIITTVDARVLAAVLAAAMVACWGVGWRWGRLQAKEGRPPPTGKFHDASVALLGLLLAFTFAMALSKQEGRRQMVVTDSNSIGDFYTCASLLKEPVRGRLRALIRQYTERRLALGTEEMDEVGFGKQLDVLEGMHDQMQVLVSEAVDAGTPPTVPLVNTFNEVTSSYTARLAALRDRLPPSVAVLLFLAAAMSTMLLGNHQGASGEQRPGAMIAFVALVSLLVWVTLDLNQPQRGLIKVSQEPMRRLLAGMDK